MDIDVNVLCTAWLANFLTSISPSVSVDDLSLDSDGRGLSLSVASTNQAI